MIFGYDAQRVKGTALDINGYRFDSNLRWPMREAGSII
jgi:hypothetical protein